jgi:hypothetical protein
MGWTYAGNSAGGNTSGTSLSITLPNAVTAGDLIVVGVVTWNGTPLTSGQVGCSDNKGNTYSLAKWETNGGVGNLATGVFWGVAVTGGASFSVTITSSVSAFLTAMAGEFSAAGATVSLNSTASANGSSTAPSTGSLTVTGTDLVFAVVNTPANVSFAAGTGFTTLNSQNSNNNESGSTEYLLDATTALNPSWTLGSSTTWQAAGAAFLASGGTAPTGISYRGRSAMHPTCLTTADILPSYWG